MWQDLPLFPPSASTLSDRVDALYFFLLALTAFFSAGIFVAVLWFAAKYRRRASHRRATQIEGSLALEVTWTAIPLAIVLVIFFWGARLYFDLSRPPDQALDVRVVAKQWMWIIRQPTGQREINELHVPTGTPVRLVMTTEDVIHSFYVPAFRMKRDVLPGRV